MEKAGPYAGRKGAAFKGKIWERKKEQRLADLKKLLEGADAKAQAWKKVSHPSITLRNHRLTFYHFAGQPGFKDQGQTCSTFLESTSRCLLRRNVSHTALFPSF